MGSPRDLCRAGARIHGKKWPYGSSKVGGPPFAETTAAKSLCICLGCFPSMKGVQASEFRRFPPAWHSQNPAPNSDTGQGTDHSCQVPSGSMGHPAPSPGHTGPCTCLHIPCIVQKRLKEVARGCMPREVSF